MNDLIMNFKNEIKKELNYDVSLHSLKNLEGRNLKNLKSFISIILTMEKESSTLKSLARCINGIEVGFYLICESKNDLNNILGDFGKALTITKKPNSFLKVTFDDSNGFYDVSEFIVTFDINPIEEVFVNFKFYPIYKNKEKNIFNLNPDKIKKEKTYSTLDNFCIVTNENIYSLLIDLTGDDNMNNKEILKEKKEVLTCEPPKEKKITISNNCTPNNCTPVFLAENKYTNFAIRMAEKRIKIIKENFMTILSEIIKFDKEVEKNFENKVINDPFVDTHILINSVTITLNAKEKDRFIEYFMRKMQNVREFWHEKGIIFNCEYTEIKTEALSSKFRIDTTYTLKLGEVDIDSILKCKN